MVGLHVSSPISNFTASKRERAEPWRLNSSNEDLPPLRRAAGRDAEGFRSAADLQSFPKKCDRTRGDISDAAGALQSLRPRTNHSAGAGGRTETTSRLGNLQRAGRAPRYRRRQAH